MELIIILFRLSPNEEHKDSSNHFNGLKSVAFQKP